MSETRQPNYIRDFSLQEELLSCIQQEMNKQFTLAGTIGAVLGVTQYPVVINPSDVVDMLWVSSMTPRIEEDGEEPLHSINLTGLSPNPSSQTLQLTIPVGHVNERGMFFIDRGMPNKAAFTVYDHSTQLLQERESGDLPNLDSTLLRISRL